MLQHLPADVQGKIGGVHYAPHEAEVVGQQVGALVHDEHAGGIELEPLLILPCIEVVGRLGGDIEHGLIGHSPLSTGVDDGQGVLPVAEFLLIEGVVLLRLHLGLLPLPQGDHGVESFPLLDGLPFRFVVLGGVSGLVLPPIVLYLHDNGIADIVGVFLDKLL